MHLICPQSTDPLQCEDQIKAKLFLTKFSEAKTQGRKVHRVAEFFCGNGPGNLSEDFGNWANHGDMSTELRTWLTAYQLCSLDDSMQESPHGIIARYQQSRPRSLPANWAAFYRHRQSVEIKRSLDMKSPHRFGTLFTHWRSLFSMKSTVGHRLKRRGSIEKKFLEKVYRMNHFSFRVNGTPMKKEQDKFLASITDRKTPVTHLGKLVREYLRIVLKPSDIIGINLGEVDAGEGHALENGFRPPPQNPETFSIVSSDHYRLKTIVTSSRSADFNLAAPFLVPLHGNIMESHTCICAQISIYNVQKSILPFPRPLQIYLHITSFIIWF